MAVAGTIDDALALLGDTGPEFAGGLSNHGPMAAEALIQLGRADAVIPWVERYRKRLQPRPEATQPVDRESWRESLGDFRRFGDWVAFFQRELSGAAWQTVVAEWVPLLAPGLVAAAMHGIIRTAHAVRSLAAGETPARVDELAQGLGYWAARYQELPGTDAGRGRAMPSEALAGVPKLPEAHRRGRLIMDGLIRLDGDDRFPGVIDRVGTSGDASAFLSDLTRTFAAVCLGNVEGFGKAVTFIHTVTGPSAIRLLLPHLPADASEPLLRYGWQAAAAVYAAFGSATDLSSERGPFDTADLVDRAVATGDEHVIKFTDACLREHAISPHPIYREAAVDAIRRFTEAR
jgi:hypothetical protein